VTALLLTRADVERLLTLDECIGAVEDVFRRHAIGEAAAPGVLALCDASDGSPVAVMDSMAVTALRTTAATAVATKYLAQARALCRTRKPRRIYAYDQDVAAAAVVYRRAVARQEGVRFCFNA